MITLKTPRCRLCGGADPEQVDVPGGSVSLCAECLSHLRNGRLDVKIAGTSDPDYRGTGEAGTCAVLASYDGGRWNRVRNPDAAASAGRRGGGRFAVRPGSAGPVSVDGLVFDSAQNAALSMGVHPQKLRDALKSGATEYAGHSVAYVEKGER